MTNFYVCVRFACFIISVTIRCCTFVRTQFQSNWVGLGATEAYIEIKAWLDERMIYVIPIVAFIFLSLIAGIVVSGVVLTCRNIMGTMSFFANILLMGISAIFFVLGSIISRVLQNTPSLWTLSIPTFVPAIVLLAVGVMGVLHLCSCVKTKGKVCE